MIYCAYSVSTISKGRQARPQRLPSARVNLRINSRTKALLVQAAKLEQVKLTEFMVKASQAAAETALAGRTKFVLSPEKWREFNAALDSPPREIAALRRLLKEASVFDGK